jgi:hypothetical protein
MALRSAWRWRCSSTGSGSVGATFQLGAMFGVGRSGGTAKTSLISLTSEERRTRPHMRASIAPRGRRPKPLAVGTRCNPHEDQAGTGAAMFFTFPEDARWNAERQSVEFGGRDRRIPRRGHGPRGACSIACFPGGRPPSCASKPPTSSGPGSRASPRGSRAGGSDRGRERRDQPGFARGNRWKLCRQAGSGSNRPRPCKNGWSRGGERPWVSAVPVAGVQHVSDAVVARRLARVCAVGTSTMEPR